MEKIKIGGVPEHFNLPWHLAIERGDLKKENIDLQWTDYPGGTGAMCTDLNEGKIDLALVLTEGIITDILKGGRSKIIQLYVTSPLIWGIHIPGDYMIQNINELKNKRYAISRTGSGSHLMAYVDAQIRGWDLEREQLIIVQNLEGARKAFKNKEAEIFFWEKFTTKPYVDSGEFKRIDVRPTPWPCFILAGNENSLKKYPGFIPAIQNIIINACKDLKSNPEASDLISKKYNLKKEDVKEWFSNTTYAESNRIESNILEKVMDTLKSLNLVERKIEAGKLCSNFTVLI